MTHCSHCHRRLDLDQAVAPILGLTPVSCQHCSHQHLLSASELREARQHQAELEMSERIQPRFWGTVRRFLGQSA